MQKITELVLSYVASDINSPGSLEEHKCAMAVIGDTYLHQQFCLHRSSICTCNASFLFVISFDRALFGWQFVFIVTSIRAAFKKVYQLPEFTLGGRQKKNTVAVPVAVWIRRVDSVLPDLANDPLVLAYNRKKVSSSLRSNPNGLATYCLYAVCANHGQRAS